MTPPRNIFFAFGTRPEAIKLAPLALAMQDISGLRITLASSGQHQGLLRDALAVFGLQLQHEFLLGQRTQGLASLTAQMLEQYHALLQSVKPDLVVVHGDTATSFAAALAAYYLRLPIAHVEAGLRTYQKYHSFPEEANRRMVACLADLHFAPTESAKQNLLCEQVPADAISVTGNTVIDALCWVLRQKPDPFHATHPLAPYVQKPFILVTAHRRESWGEVHRNYFHALQQVAVARPDLSIIFPIHPNPLLQDETRQWLTADNIHLVAPQDYYHFVYLMRRAFLVVTDSGSIQEETTFLGKPTIVIREMTERVDALASGTATLAEGSAGVLAQYMLKLLSDPAALHAMSRASHVYGDGTASQQIARNIGTWLKTC